MRNNDLYQGLGKCLVPGTSPRMFLQSPLPHSCPEKPTHHPASGPFYWWDSLEYFYSCTCTSWSSPYVTSYICSSISHFLPLGCMLHGDRDHHFHSLSLTLSLSPGTQWTVNLVVNE
jgi:hypothetical protein